LNRFNRADVSGQSSRTHLPEAGFGFTIQNGAKTRKPTAYNTHNANYKSNKRGAKEEDNDTDDALNIDIAAGNVNLFHFEASSAGFNRPVDVFLFAFDSRKKFNDLSSSHRFFS